MGTGRTHRMLEEAVREARNGRNVIVVCFHHHIPIMRQRLATMVGDAEWLCFDRLALADSSGLITLRPVGKCFDWKQMRYLDTPLEVLTLVDHHVIETMYSRMLAMLQRWDDVVRVFDREGG